VQSWSGCSGSSGSPELASRRIFEAELTVALVLPDDGEASTVGGREGAQRLVRATDRVLVDDRLRDPNIERLRRLVPANPARRPAASHLPEDPEALGIAAFEGFAWENAATSSPAAHRASKRHVPLVMKRLELRVDRVSADVGRRPRPSSRRSDIGGNHRARATTGAGSDRVLDDRGGRGADGCLRSRLRERAT
jgi:hypothetical protein